MASHDWNEQQVDDPPCEGDDPVRCHPIMAMIIKYFIGTICCNLCAINFVTKDYGCVHITKHGNLSDFGLKNAPFHFLLMYILMLNHIHYTNRRFVLFEVLLGQGY